MPVIIPTLNLETVYWNKGYAYVIGMDEVGRGCIAGPVMVGAVVFPTSINEQTLAGIRDSKLISAQKREQMNLVIQDHAFATSVGEIDNRRIDSYGITWAIHQAALQALKKINVDLSNAFILADHNLFSSRYPIKYQYAHVDDGDSVCMSIAAASILAKVWRDKVMHQYAQVQPYHLYGWEQNVGYGTKNHREAIQMFGISDLHRKTFTKNTAPLRS